MKTEEMAEKLDITVFVTNRRMEEARPFFRFFTLARGIRVILARLAGPLALTMHRRLQLGRGLRSFLF
jgi:hypothetical protein